jgi:hypothetical protein
MKLATCVVAGGLLALAALGCGRYGPPVRAPQSAPVQAAPAPAPEPPLDSDQPRGSVLEDLGEPEP